MSKKRTKKTPGNQNKPERKPNKNIKNETKIITKTHKSKNLKNTKKTKGNKHTKKPKELQ